MQQISQRYAKVWQIHLFGFVIISIKYVWLSEQFGIFKAISNVEIFLKITSYLHIILGCFDKWMRGMLACNISLSLSS